jgi:hypothetical protein
LVTPGYPARPVGEMARSNKGQMARPYFGKAEESQRARKLKS